MFSPPKLQWILLVLLLAQLLFAEKGGNDNFPVQVDTAERQRLENCYLNGDQSFRERYILSAYVYLFKLKLGHIEIGEVIISDRDSFSITYNPPFEKWDTGYLSYWQDDSGFVDEVIARNGERFEYRKINDKWHFTQYDADKPREFKLKIYQTGFQTGAVNLIELVRLLFQRRFTEINEVLFLAETYQIGLKRLKDSTDDICAYELQWKVRSGEELVRLHGVRLFGLENRERFVPLGGILKMSFVGLLDMDLIGILKK